jgi:hypothetical protein
MLSEEELTNFVVSCICIVFLVHNHENVDTDYSNHFGIQFPYSLSGVEARKPTRTFEYPPRDFVCFPYCTNPITPVVLERRQYRGSQLL